jgi:archaellum component FlaC
MPNKATHAAATLTIFDLDQSVGLTLLLNANVSLNSQGERVMAERIDEFCENLRVRLTSIDNEMQSLKAKIDRKVKTAGQDVQTQLNAVKKRIEQDRAKLTAAQNDMQKWMEERKSATREKVAEWRAKLEKAKLQSYADSAERYAAAAAVIALAAVDEAQEAALEAWLARREADSAQGSQAA